MKFVDTSIAGVVRVEVDRIEDDRGYFGRYWCEREFSDAGLDVRWRQGNVGSSIRRGTLRGMHFQRVPHEEVKLVRCTRGSVFDVAIDLRPTSPTFRTWTAAELSWKNGSMLLIPEGCAHGYLTLTDESEILYLTSAFYEADAAAGVRYDDPAFGIEWPIPIEVISEQDRIWPIWGDADGTTHGRET
jgi:dTDP-4-dehydrorhamnose 3,5-epimerase